MAWLNRDKAPLTKGVRKDTPDGMWDKCKKCSQVIFRANFVANLYVCPKCQHHFPCPPLDRLTAFLDPDSFKERDQALKSADPLEFVDTRPYRERLIEAQNVTGSSDAFVAGEGLLHGRPVQVGAFDFGFMGGSMGSVVGEKVSRIFQRSVERHEPAIIYTSSGGARMQEGILSLMQMAKTCAALTSLRDHGIPFISVMCHPTTGGVAASFAMLGDINIGEPLALIGFAGPRVIGQTIRQELPKGFQTAEYLLSHGMLDLICQRQNQRQTISDLLNMLLPPIPAAAPEVAAQTLSAVPNDD